MVDIHSHVLFGMDDGARSIEASLAMLRKAALNGTSDLVATPHANLQYTFQPLEIIRQIEIFSSEPDIPSLHRGCDFHLSFDNVEAFLNSPATYTINGLRYLLVEFADHAIAPSLTDVFRRMLAQGVSPIITHPERNPILSRNPKQLEEFVREGCLVQVTAQSITGDFGKTAESAARRWLSQNLVHFVASDAHDVKHRPPHLRAAFDLVKRDYGNQTADALFEANPRAVLTGASLPDPVQNVTKPRRWFKL